MKKRGCLGSLLGSVLGLSVGIWYGFNFVPPNPVPNTSFCMDGALFTLGFVISTSINGVFAGCFLGTIAGFL